MRFLFWGLGKKERQEEWQDKMELIVEEIGQAILMLVIGVAINLLFLGVLEQITSF